MSRNDLSIPDAAKKTASAARMGCGNTAGNSSMPVRAAERFTLVAALSGQSRGTRSTGDISHPRSTRAGAVRP